MAGICVSHAQLFSFQILYAIAKTNRHGTEQIIEREHLEWQRAIMEINFVLRTISLRGKHHGLLSQKFHAFKKCVELEVANDFFLSIQYSFGQWEIMTQNFAERECIYHLLQCVARDLSAEDAIQCGGGIVGLDETIMKYGLIFQKLKTHYKKAEQFVIIVPGKLLMFEGMNIVGSQVQFVISLVGATIRVAYRQLEFQILAPNSKEISLLPANEEEMTSWINSLEKSIQDAEEILKNLVDPSSESSTRGSIQEETVTADVSTKFTGQGLALNSVDTEYPLTTADFRPQPEQLEKECNVTLLSLQRLHLVLDDMINSIFNLNYAIQTKAISLDRSIIVPQQEDSTIAINNGKGILQDAQNHDGGPKAGEKSEAHTRDEGMKPSNDKQTRSSIIEKDWQRGPYETYISSAVAGGVDERELSNRESSGYPKTLHQSNLGTPAEQLSGQLQDPQLENIELRRNSNMEDQARYDTGSQKYRNMPVKENILTPVNRSVDRQSIFQMDNNEASSIVQSTLNHREANDNQNLLSPAVIHIRISQARPPHAKDVISRIFAQTQVRAQTGDTQIDIYTNQSVLLKADVVDRSPNNGSTAIQVPGEESDGKESSLANVTSKVPHYGQVFNEEPSDTIEPALCAGTSSFLSEKEKNMAYIKQSGDKRPYPLLNQTLERQRYSPSLSTWKAGEDLCTPYLNNFHSEKSDQSSSFTELSTSSRGLL